MARYNFVYIFTRVVDFVCHGGTSSPPRMGHSWYVAEIALATSSRSRVFDVRALSVKLFSIASRPGEAQRQSQTRYWL